MTDLSMVVSQQLDDLLANAPQDWLDAEPQVRQENAYLEWDTYRHQAYMVNSRISAEMYEELRQELFPPPTPNTVEWHRQRNYWGEDLSDDPTP